MPDRLPCIVPHCRCTAPTDRYPAGWVIVCAKHWRAVPQALNACRRRTRAAVRALEAGDEASSLHDLAFPEDQAFRPGLDLHLLEAERWRIVHRLNAAQRRDARLWRVCKRPAVEAAGGIS